MLEALITSRVKRKLLAFFFANPENEFYIREVSKRLGEETNAVRSGLQALADAGILYSNRKGNLRYFGVNKKCPIFEELKTMLLKTEGLGDAMRKELEKSGALFAFVYGSYAEGKERKGSDIDLMVIGDIHIDDFNKIISRIERKIGRDVNYLVYPEKEFAEKLSSGFLRDVVRSRRIMLVGEEDAFKRFVEARADTESS
ncbi:MAG: nucleotidyltransferase domain-containing protein [Candidatus Micrarchaeia archaeon]